MPRFLFAFVLVSVSCLRAQTQAQFEVVSIRPYISQGNPANEESRTNFLPGGRFSGLNVSVSKLLRFAFGMEDSRILDAPGWAATTTYDIDAKTAGGVEVTRDKHRGAYQVAARKPLWISVSSRDAGDSEVRSRSPEERPEGEARYERREGPHERELERAHGGSERDEAFDGGFRREPGAAGRTAGGG